MEIRLRIGDVVRLREGAHIVDMVNECRARCIPLTREQRSYCTRFGEWVTFQTLRRPVSICPLLEADLVCERRGRAGLRRFLRQRSK